MPKHSRSAAAGSPTSGSTAGARALAGTATEVIDLAGRMVLPGIHDGHMHPLSGGLVLTQPSLNYRELNLKQFVAAIRKLLARSVEEEPDGWLQVELWDATAMDKLPTKEDLDKLETSRPILVISLDGHIALANSRALEIGGVDASTPDPPGGEIRRGPGREPTGILLDGAINLVFDQIPERTPEQNAKALAAALRVMAKQGITSFLEVSAGEDELAALALLSDQGGLTARPSVAITGGSKLAEDPAALLAHAEQLRTTYGRPDIAIRTVKLFFDGVIEYPTQTAALLKPYLVNKGTKKDPKWVPGKSRGPTYFPQRVANAAIAALDAAGWQVHVHAIGDRAVRSALDAFEHARGVNGANDNRHTICHLELIHPKDFRRFAKLGVLPSMQMQWAERDSYTVERLKPYLGTKRWRHTYPAGSLKRAGALLCGGSDWPVDPLLPFRQIEMAVNRTADEVYKGDPEPLFADQGLKLRDSIAMHTRNSAFQLHREALERADRGRIRRRPRRPRPRPSPRAVEEGLAGEGRDDPRRWRDRPPRLTNYRGGGGSRTLKRCLIASPAASVSFTESFARPASAPFETRRGILPRGGSNPVVRVRATGRRR